MWNVFGVTTVTVLWAAVFFVRLEVISWTNWQRRFVSRVADILVSHRGSEQTEYSQLLLHPDTSADFLQ